MFQTISPTPPYDFSLTSRVAPFYAVLGRSLVIDGQPVYRRALRVGDPLRGPLALVEIRGDGTPDTPRLQARVLTADSVLDEAAIEERIRWMLHADDDLRPFYLFAAADPVLAETARRMYGLRLFRMNSLFEALVTTIIEQQITLKGAQAGERWLVATYGDYLEYEGERYYVFPTPERLAALELADLTPLKITFQRIARILALARAEAAGEFSFHQLASAPRDDLYATLRTFKGVGHWTAAWAMIRLGHFIPMGSADVALRAAVNAYHYNAPGRLDRAALDVLHGSYGEFAGTVALFTILRWALDKY